MDRILLNLERFFEAMSAWPGGAQSRSRSQQWTRTTMWKLYVFDENISWIFVGCWHPEDIVKLAVYRKTTGDHVTTWNEACNPHEACNAHVIPHGPWVPFQVWTVLRSTLTHNLFFLKKGGNFLELPTGKLFVWFIINR